MPLYRRLPKIGFTSRKKTRGENRFTLVPIAVLEAFEDGDTVTPEKLFELGFIPSADERAGFKLLNDGEVSKKLTVKVHAVSEACCEAIKKAGGVVELIGQ
jgi:large subunit ribosomal protein L15